MKKLIIAAAAFSIISAVKYVFEVSVLRDFAYEQLRISSLAVSRYTTVSLISLFEFVSFAILILMVGLVLIKFTRKRTGLSPKSERYGKLDRELHNEMKKGCIGWIVLGIALGGAKLFVTLARGHLTALYPILFLFWFIFMAYGYYLFDNIKEEIKLKYS